MGMGDTLFIGDVPIESSISSGFSIATFDSQRATGKTFNVILQEPSRWWFDVYSWVNYNDLTIDYG